MMTPDSSPRPRPPVRNYRAWCAEEARSIQLHALPWLNDCLEVLREIGFEFPSDHPSVKGAAEGAVVLLLEGLAGEVETPEQRRRAAARCVAAVDTRDHVLLQQEFFKTLGAVLRVREGGAAILRSSGDILVRIDRAVRASIVPEVLAKDWHLMERVVGAVPAMPRDPDLILNRVAVHIIDLHHAAWRR